MDLKLETTQALCLQCKLLVGCICQYRYVIGVVGVCNCFCGVPSASFVCQLEAVFSDFINRCSMNNLKIRKESPNSSLKEKA